MDYSSEILELCKLCKTVDLYISTQSYKNDQTDPEDPDSITEQEILVNCYVIILQELRLLGIETHIEWEDAIANFYDAKAYAYLLAMLDKDKLISVLNTKYDQKERFLTIFENSEYSEDDLLKVFLDVYFYFVPTEPHRDKILMEVDNLYSNDTFKEYMSNVLSSLSPISTINLENLDMIKTYINKIVEGRKYFETIMNLLVEKTSNIPNGITMSNYIRNAIDTYDEEKIAGTDISRYCWAVMSDDNELSDKEKELKKAILFEHTSHQTHHIEYYHIRHIKPTIEQLAELVAHHVEPDSTDIDFVRDVEDMIKQDMNDIKFTAFNDSDIEIINTFTKIIIENFYKSTPIENHEVN